MRDPGRAWDAQYASPTFLSLGTEPTADVLRFYKAVKKEWRKLEAETGEERLDATSLRVIDLGCGNGKNALYFADLGADAAGVDVSRVAIEMAKKEAARRRLSAQFAVADLAAPLAFDDDSFDVALDMTTSHSLSPAARKQFVAEVARILVPGGRLLARLLCLDGDENAKALVKSNPGPDGSYILPDTGLPEWPISKAEIERIYGPAFTVVSLERSWHYAPFGEKRFKRAYWTLYARSRA